jgi:DNA-directed RNA polymerase sigma subunit (sigma70/sigma32)
MVASRGFQIEASTQIKKPEARAVLSLRFLLTNKVTCYENYTLSIIGNQQNVWRDSVQR